MTEITTDLLLAAYAQGMFPMAEDRHDTTLFWVDPDFRGIIPLEDFRVPKRLAKTVRQDVFEIRYNTAFDKVIESCAAPARARGATWISGRIVDLYKGLHEIGHAHSIECWQKDRLVGGLYGVSLGHAFFGESMFSVERDASKVALVHLVAQLKHYAFRLLDAQFVTEHLKQFGAVEIPRTEYLEILENAIYSNVSSSASVESRFISSPSLDWASNGITGELALQSISQTS